MLSLTLPFGRVEDVGAGSLSPNALVRIDSEGEAFLTLPYVEEGQDSHTLIARLVAEELEVSLNIHLEYAPRNERLYFNPMLAAQAATNNSDAVRDLWKTLHEAAATARTMLIAATARRWDVDA